MVGPVAVAIWTMVAVSGGLLILAGWRGLLPRLDERSGTTGRLDYLPLRLTLAALGTVGPFLATGWPVAALYCGLGGFFLPTLAASKRRRREAVERVEAIATWVESLRDTMAASAGIQEAIRASARVAPAPVREEVRTLSLRLQHQSVSRALRQFAVDMAHPLTDMVVASLILATSRQAGSLQQTLAVTATGARDSAAMWRQVEGRRARTYSQARLAGWGSAAMIVLMVASQRSTLTPYDSSAGQFVLLFIGGIFFASAVAIYRLSQPTQPRRLFEGIEKWGGDGNQPIFPDGPIEAQR